MLNELSILIIYWSFYSIFTTFLLTTARTDLLILLIFLFLPWIKVCFCNHSFIEENIPEFEKDNYKVEMKFAIISR